MLEGWVICALLLFGWILLGLPRCHHSHIYPAFALLIIITIAVVNVSFLLQGSPAPLQVETVTPQLNGTLTFNREKRSISWSIIASKHDITNVTLQLDVTDIKPVNLCKSCTITTREFFNGTLRQTPDGGSLRHIIDAVLNNQTATLKIYDVNGAA